VKPPEIRMGGYQRWEATVPVSGRQHAWREITLVVSHTQIVCYKYGTADGRTSKYDLACSFDAMRAWVHRTKAKMTKGKP